MRQIDAVLALIVFLITGKKASFEDFAQTASRGNDLYLRLNDLVKQRKICEAENMIFDAIDIQDRSVLEVAILFYSDINKLTDDELEESGFSRDEVRDGLGDVCSAYGIQCNLLLRTEG